MNIESFKVKRRLPQKLEKKLSYTSVKLKNQVWTLHEINLLVKLYSNHDNYYISKVLEKTKASIDIKASMLSLRKSENYRKKINRLNNQKKHHAWTEKEIGFLTKNYLDKNYTQIADALKRTASAVSQKARQLNLHKYMKKRL